MTELGTSLFKADFETDEEIVGSLTALATFFLKMGLAFSP